jgi:hypothetical protein
VSLEKKKELFLIADVGFLRDYKPRNENKYKNVNHLSFNYHR